MTAASVASFKSTAAFGGMVAMGVLQAIQAALFATAPSLSEVAAVLSVITSLASLATAVLGGIVAFKALRNRKRSRHAGRHSPRT